MEEFKIEMFEEEYKKNFPTHESLTRPECQDLVNRLSTKYDLSSSNLEADLASKQSFYSECDAMDNFALIDTLQNLGIEPMPIAFVNWYRFERIDSFNIIDLDKYFYDIWFPSADDIDLFDESLSWILSIRHDGCVTFLK